MPTDRAAMGSGANNSAHYLGSAISITIVAVIVTGAGAAHGTAGLLSAWNAAVLVAAGFSLGGAGRAAGPGSGMAGQGEL